MDVKKKKTPKKQKCQANFVKDLQNSSSLLHSELIIV